MTHSGGGAYDMLEVQKYPVGNKVYIQNKAYIWVCKSSFKHPFTPQVKQEKLLQQK